VNVVPSSSIALVKLNDTIGFSGGSLMSTPTCHASYRCFTATPTEGYPWGGEFVGRVRRDQKLEGARNTKFRQVRAAESLRSLRGLYCLRCWSGWSWVIFPLEGGHYPPLYSLGVQGYIEIVTG
jgi:hypothetical protein